jgi:hypothetical protein
MGTSQCGNDQPGFGMPAITQKLRASNYKRFLGFKSIVHSCFVYIPAQFPSLNAGNGRLSSSLTGPRVLFATIPASNHGPMHIAPSH